MTNGATKPQIIESNKSREEVALDRAVSELFYSFGLVDPLPPSIGMSNIKPAPDTTFTERMMTVLKQHAPRVYAIMEKYFEYQKIRKLQNKLLADHKVVQEEAATHASNPVKHQELKQKELDIAERIGLTVDRMNELQQELHKTTIDWTTILNNLEKVELLLGANKRREILPSREGSGSYGREFVAILNHTIPQA